MIYERLVLNNNSKVLQHRRPNRRETEVLSIFDIETYYLPKDI